MDLSSQHCCDSFQQLLTLSTPQLEVMYCLKSTISLVFYNVICCVALSPGIMLFVFVNLQAVQSMLDPVSFEKHFPVELG